MRSQTSTEYLVIVSVVIIIAVIVIGVLGGIPGIGGGSSIATNNANLKTKEIGVIDYALTTNNTVITLMNNQNHLIQINSLIINNTVCITSNLPAILTQGGKVTVTCSNIYGSTSNVAYSLQSTIIYTDKVTNAQYNLTVGSLVGTVGRAANVSTNSTPLTQWFTSGPLDFKIVDGVESLYLIEFRNRTNNQTWPSNGVTYRAWSQYFNAVIGTDFWYGNGTHAQLLLLNGTIAPAGVDDLVTAFATNGFNNNTWNGFNWVINNYESRNWSMLDVQFGFWNVISGFECWDGEEMPLPVCLDVISGIENNTAYIPAVGEKTLAGVWLGPDSAIDRMLVEFTIQ